MTGYEMGKYWLLHTLETYRDTPPGAAKRQFIDRLIDWSRHAAGTSPLEKQYHNLIVLRYITDTRPSVQRICAALHLARARAYYEAATENAIDRLLALVFGVNGIDWNSSGTGREPPGNCPGNSRQKNIRGKNPRIDTAPQG